MTHYEIPEKLIVSYGVKLPIYIALIQHQTRIGLPETPQMQSQSHLSVSTPQRFYPVI
jgi:hypothetical protein